MPIRLFFATNRAGPLPTPLGGQSSADELRFGEAQVDALGDPLMTEPDRRLREITVTGALSLADPVPALAADTALAAWFEACGDDGIPLLWLHGFANGFADTLKRAAQIVEFYEGGDPGARIVPLLLSWPSSGVTLGGLQNLATAEKPYRDDQDAAQRSGPALARLVLEILAARHAAGAAGQRLVLVAHSMGNWLLLNALDVLGPGFPRQGDRGAFRHALQMAADVDWGAWAPDQPLRRLAALAEQVTIGTNVDPVLQTVSAIANHRGKRLGHYGPRHLDTLPGNVVVLDCWPGINSVDSSRIRQQGGTDWNSIGHQYYRNNQNVRAHLSAAFAGARPDELEETRVALEPARRWSGGAGPDGDRGQARGRTHDLLPSVFDIAGPDF